MLKKFSFPLVLALVFAFTILLVVACGAPPRVHEAAPAVEESEAVASDGEGGQNIVDAISAEGDNAEAVADAPAEQTPETVEVVATEETAEITAGGIPVGFTEGGRPYIGHLDAPIVIEEFSDYQCPFCGRFFEQTLPSIKSDAIANGDVVLIFFDFPLDFHQQAIPAANAARCAGEEGAAAYWEMHDQLFADVQRWSNPNPNEAFIALAAEVGLDEAAFTECVESGRYEDAIQADLSEGFSRGVSGTPTFFINDQILVGAQPLATFEQAIATVANGGQIAAAPQEASAAPADIPPFQMPEPVPFDEATFAAVLGDPDAPITVVEFSDYQCPFCLRHFNETMPRIVQALIETGRVRYAFKDFPLDSIHPEARAAAVAARCAGEQEAYWEMHDRLFSEQENWAGTGGEANTFFVQYAKDLDLDADAFSACLKSGRYDDAIQANVDEGLSKGVNGTPAFFIGGYPFSGARPYELFELLVTNIEEGTLEALFREAYDRQVAAIREQQQQEQQQEAPQRPSEPVDVPIEGSFSIGDPDAPVVVVEYTDFQCPFCGRHFANTFPQIVENYVDQGLVRYVFKDFPLRIHPQAVIAAAAARCAGEQDAFLEMHDLLFTNQEAWGHSGAADVFAGYAADLGLDVEAFSACVSSGKYEEAIQADLEEGINFGVTGTPTFFINGRPLVGAVPYQTFAQAIDTLLDE